jgi:hypothetical protein
VTWWIGRSAGRCYEVAATPPLLTFGGSSSRRRGDLDVTNVGEAEKYLASPDGAADPPANKFLTSTLGVGRSAFGVCLILFAQYSANASSG